MVSNTRESWFVNGSQTTTAIWVQSESGERICTVKNCAKDADRAALLAASPDLLRALKGMVAASNRYQIGRDYDIAIAAIAKAEGK